MNNPNPSDELTHRNREQFHPHLLKNGRFALKGVVNLKNKQKHIVTKLMKNRIQMVEAASGSSNLSRNQRIRLFLP